jgi:hypothetical protein
VGRIRISTSLTVHYTKDSEKGQLLHFELPIYANRPYFVSQGA